MDAAKNPHVVEFLRQGGDSFLTTRAEAVVNWSRKYSMFLYPFVTACCGMEFMSVAGPRYDLDRFGCALPRFSPRQADLLMVVGTITHRQAPILKRVYDQMAEPKWVIAFGACTCSGGPYNNYAVVQGIDTIVPVDVYIPGCPRARRPYSTGCSSCKPGYRRRRCLPMDATGTFTSWRPKWWRSPSRSSGPLRSRPTPAVRRP